MNSSEVTYLRGNACDDWLHPQNPSYHVSMAVAAAAFLVARTFKYYVITFRGLLTVALIVFIGWGAAFWCTWDVIIWGGVFLIQNLAQLVFAFYKMRRITFSPDLEDVYSELFEPFGVSRHQFKSLINYNCRWVNIFPGDKYAVEGHTTVEARVSLLVSGCLRVSFRGVYLHDVREKQFLDSVEWESTKLRRGELFQVSAEAIDRCFYLCWNREKLQFYLEANPGMQAAFDFIRGRDIMDKVYQTAKNASRRSESKEEKKVDAIGIRLGIVEENPALIYK